MEIRRGIPNPWQPPFFPGHVMRTSWPGWASVLIFIVCAAWDSVTIVLWPHSSCLHSWSPVGGALWGDCRTFREWSLVGGSGSRGAGLGALWPHSPSSQMQYASLLLLIPCLPCLLPCTVHCDGLKPSVGPKTLSSSFKFHLLTNFITPRESNSVTIKTT